MARFGVDASSSDSGSSSSSERSVSYRSVGPKRPTQGRKTTFVPAEVNLKSARSSSLGQSGRSLALASESSSSSDEDDDQDDSEDEEIDSEEEEYPVGPIGSVGLGGWRREGTTALLHRNRRKGKGRAPDQTVGQLFGEEDLWESWESREKASTWSIANRSFHLSLSRSLSESPAPKPAANDLFDTDLDSIRSLFSTLAVSAAAETLALNKSFESRNAALWSSIEASIKEAENEKALEESRAKGLIAEKKAKEMREAEEQKVLLEKASAHEEQKRTMALAAEKRAQEVAAAALKAAAPKVVAPPKVASEGSPQADFERWTAKMTYIKTNVLPIVSSNPTFRKSCFAAKRAITPKIGQLTNAASAISIIITQLDAILSEIKPSTGSTTGFEPYIWTLNHLSKALVRQADTEITAKLSTAYPLGRIVIGLLLRGHTELGEVLMARLVKKCFWITGWWPPKRPDQSAEDHKKSLGHAAPASGETLVQYAQRQAGLVALYAAILQTSPLESPQAASNSSPSLVPAHFQPSAAWRWLNIILQPPLITLEPTPLLLVTFLEITGVTMVQVYGRQMEKYLECLLREGLREGKAKVTEKNRASLVRLMLWLEEWEKTGRVEGCKGREVEP